MLTVIDGQRRHQLGGSRIGAASSAKAGQPARRIRLGTVVGTIGHGSHTQIVYIIAKTGTLFLCNPVIQGLIAVGLRGPHHNVAVAQVIQLIRAAVIFQHQALLVQRIRNSTLTVHALHIFQRIDEGGVAGHIRLQLSAAVIALRLFHQLHIVGHNHRFVAPGLV